MRKQKVTNLKAADLTVFYDEKDPQQYLVYDLTYGETVIGSSSEKSQLVLRFASELNDAHAKISIEGEEYSIEDLGSQKGTFKIKSDDSLIRLKPFKSYDLSPQMAFYLGRFKCVFRAVKSGRAAGLFSLSPLDGNNQRGKNQVQRQMSLEDDIEEDEVSRKSKKSLMQKLSKNQQESELIDDEVERKAIVSKLVVNKQIRLVEQHNNLQSQKKFVKSKGQLPKAEEEQSKDKESIQLNKSFLERIQERLKNQQKEVISDVVNKNNSEKKKNQEIKSIGKEGRKVNQMEEEEEEVWTPLKMKTQKKESEESEKKNKKLTKVEDKNLSKIDKIIADMIGNNVDQKIIKAKEQIKEEKGLTKKKVDKKLEAKGADDVDKIKEINGTDKGRGQVGANKRNIDKQSFEEKAKKGLSKGLSEKKTGSKKQQGKEEEEIKEVKNTKREKIEKKEEKMIDTKKSAAEKKATQKEEQKEVIQKKGKAKKEHKNVVEDTEEEMVFEKKSTPVVKSKKAASKSEANGEVPKKSVGKQKLEKIEASKEITKVSSSKKKAVADVKAANKQGSTSKKDKALLGKRKATQNDIEEDIPKKKVKKQEENEPEGKAKSDKKKNRKKDKDNKKNTKVSSSAAKRELAQLNREGNVILDSVSRRDKLRVLFSNSCVNDTEKEQLSQLGVQIVNDYKSASDFDILVTDQISRRVKILVAINKGIPIVESAWVKKSIKQKDALPFEPFVITKAGKELFNQHSFTFSESRMRQLEHPQGVLYGVVFNVPYPLGNITHVDFYKLIQSAGATGTFLLDKKTYTVTESSRNVQNKELLKLGHKLVSEEGILQSCLLQENVLDDYLIKKEPTTSNKKTAKK